MVNYSIASRAGTETVVVNSLIRNTYLLLSMTLLFSAAMAGLSMVLHVQPMPFLTFIGYFGLYFLTVSLQNSAMGILAVFAFTGFMGFTLGPILSMYLATFSNGSQLIMTALGATGIVFFALSAYALNAKRDFSYLSGFLVAGSMVLLLGMLASLFLPIPGLYLLVSAGFVLLSSGLILFETNQIVQGGQRNYIMATISLYVSIYNLFVSLLQLLAMLAGRDD